MKNKISILLITMLLIVSTGFADSATTEVLDSNESSEIKVGDVAKHIALSPIYVLAAAGLLAETVFIGTLAVGKTVVDKVVVDKAEK